MSSKPLVSIIVPTYNRPEFLARALKSIHAQTHRNYEVLVINDGGEDVEQVVKGFSKTKYLSHPDNRGLPAARNTGIRAARGEWIAYLDDDDWFYPNHLELLTSWTHKARFLYSNSDYIDRRGRVKIYMDIDPDPGNILSHNITPVCCVMHHRDVLLETGLFDETLKNHEDWDLWIRMSKVTDMYHVKESTCCVDRSRPTMLSDTDAMLHGMLLVKWRYRTPQPR